VDLREDALLLAFQRVDADEELYEDGMVHQPS
jgi:hypothetical protein